MANYSPMESYLVNKLAFLFSIACLFSTDPLLEVGQAVRGEIEPSDQIVHTRTLDMRYTPIPVRAKRFRLSVPDSGVYRIDFGSHSFDTYLILRDSTGTLIAEDDDGWIPTQSRLTVELAEGRDFFVYAAAMHGGIGPFEISLHKGAAPTPSPQEYEEWTNDARRDATETRYQARNLFRTGKWDVIRKLLEHSLEIAEKGLGPAHQETAACLFDLGRLCSRQADYSKARALIERAIKIQEDLFGSEDIQACDSYYEMGLTFLDEGNLPSARHWLQMSMEGLAKLPLNQGARIDHSIVEKQASIAFALGDWITSERLFRQTRALSEILWGKESAQANDNLAMIGASLIYQGRFAEAKAFLEQALSAFEQNGQSDPSLAMTIRINLAIIAKVEGDDEYERALLQKAVSDNSFPTINTVQALQMLGASYRRAGDPKQAKAVIGRSGAIAKSLSLDPSSCLASLADIELELMNLEEARKLIQEIQEKKGSTFDSVDACSRVGFLNLLGRLQFLEGNLPEAKSSFEGTIETANLCFGKPSPAQAYIYRELTHLSIEIGDLRQAWEFAKKSYEVSKGVVQGNLWALSETERYEFVLAQRLGLETVLDMAQRMDAPEIRELAFAAVVLWKSQVYRGMLSTKHKVFQQPKKGIQEAVEKLRQVQSQISAIMSLLDSKGQLALEMLVRLQKERATLERQIAGSVKIVSNDASVDWRSLQAALPLGGNLVSIIEVRNYVLPTRSAGQCTKERSLSNPRLTAWVLSKEGNGPIQVDLGPSAQVESLVRAFLAELVTQRPNGARQAATAALNCQIFEKIWKPICAQIKGDLVLISPDGVLGVLPLGVIQQPNGRYLVEDFSFAYVQDAKDIANLISSEGTCEGSLLVVGGMEFPPPWPALLETMAEGQAIFDLHSRVLNKPRLFLKGVEPTKEAIKSSLGKFSFVHIASHGFFRPEGLDVFGEEIEKFSLVESGQYKRRFSGLLPGLQSGIVCANPSNSGSDPKDGLLRAEELSWLDLSGCALVVLSACQTGLGTTRDGEGVIGLRSSLRQAGAKTVITSLWSVGDRSTREFFECFYEMIWIAKKGKLKSLREAQLKMIAKQRADYDNQAYPYAWGAFVLDGDWN